MFSLPSVVHVLPFQPVVRQAPGPSSDKERSRVMGADHKVRSTRELHNFLRGMCDRVCYLG